MDNDEKFIHMHGQKEFDYMLTHCKDSIELASNHKGMKLVMVKRFKSKDIQECYWKWLKHYAKEKERVVCKPLYTVEFPNQSIIQLCEWRLHC